MESPPREIRIASELVGRTGEVVDVVGIYRVVDMGRYKMVIERPDGGVSTVNHYSVVVLDDATSVRIGPRPDDEHAWQGHRVRARGRLDEAWPPRQPPHVAQPNAAPTLVEVHSVERID